MKILVTGGAGYIGSHTCIELLNSGKEIVIVDNYYNSKPTTLEKIRQITNKDFSFYECDILDKAALRKVFQAEEIDSVIHFAGLKAVGESVKIPIQYYVNNVSGTLTLLEVMKEFGIKNIIFSSSATVYGASNKPPYTEDMQTIGCSNPYGQTKYVIELILKDLYNSDSSWNICILRYFNPIGAHESGLIGEDPNGIPNNLMPYITQVSVGKLKQLSIYGDDYDTKDGTGVRDYIHVADLAIGHLKALKAKGFNIYNLGTGKGTSVLELVKAFEEVSGKEISFVITGRRAGDLDEAYASVDKAAKELGFVAKYGIEKMCLDSFNWQKKS